MSPLRTLGTSIVFLALVGGTVTLSSLPSAAQGTKKIEKKETKETTTTGTGVTAFEVYQDKGMKYRFRLKHGDELLAISGKGYETREACEAIVREIQLGAPRAKITMHHDDKK